MNETLLTRARHNYKVAKSLWDIMGSDELYLNNIGYNLQQAVELAIKYVMEINGLEYPKTHDIECLARISRINNVDLFLTEYMVDHEEMFTSWEAKTRYILNYLLERGKVERALKEVNKYLCILEKEFGVSSSVLDTVIGEATRKKTTY